jgi:hypothetical protein
VNKDIQIGLIVGCIVFGAMAIYVVAESRSKSSDISETMLMSITAGDRTVKVNFSNSEIELTSAMLVLNSLQPGREWAKDFTITTEDRGRQGISYIFTKKDQARPFKPATRPISTQPASHS